MSTSSRYRSACDRCHSQKLRCPKQPGSAICSRCQKAGARCAYSPPGTSLATSNNNNTWSSEVSSGDAVVGNDDASAAFAFEDRSDWTNLPYDLDFNSFLPTVSPDASQPNSNNAPDRISNVSVNIRQFSRNSSFEGAGNDRSACTKELASILLDSDEAWENMSHSPDLHVSSAEDGDAFLNSSSAKMVTRRVLESFFVLAQRLVNLYPAVISNSLSLKPTKNSAPNLGDCTHNFDLTRGLKEVEDSVLQDGTFTGLDSALTNLLISCHNRQLDILDRLFLLVTSCTRATLANRREPDFDVSETRVGSFVPQRTAAVLMQIALLKHLVAALTDRVASFGKAVSDWTVETTHIGLESKILKLQHEALTKRQEVKAHQVRLVEDFLLKFDLNRE